MTNLYADLRYLWFAEGADPRDNAGMETPDFLVIGCTLARELARASQKVVVVERGQIGSGASSSVAGLLAPALSASAVGPLADVPPIRNLWVSTGHYRKGILLAPLCARLYGAVDPGRRARRRIGAVQADTALRMLK
ncbi:MAG TPA: FAD-dependent oxidoreductase [Gemmataceae bacterium]|nr:FAD-dependent oxidoreductase [Gemmataceae bacterium]